MSTLWELSDLEVTRRQALGASRAALDSHRVAVRQFLRWLERTAQATELTQLQPEHIGQWLLALRSYRTSAGLPLKTITIISRHRQVKTFCRQLVREGRLSRLILDAFVSIRPPHLLPRPTPVHAQVRRFLHALPTDTPHRHMLRTIAEVLYSSGMRPSELLALNVVDVDFDRGLVKVMGKGQRERMVPLGRTAARLLESYIQGVRPLLLRDPAEHALWLNSIGHRLAYRILMETLHRPMLAKEGSPRVTCYTFRRACATEMIRSGASMWAVKELLGHEDLEKLKHYVQLTINDLKKTHARCHPRDRLE